MSKNIHAEMNIKQFQQNLKKAKTMYKKECSQIVREATRVFLNAVIKQTPPDAGKVIKKYKLYNPTVDLMAVARNGKRIWICGTADQSPKYNLSSMDGVQMHKGYRYKILIPRNHKRSGERFIYCKTKEQALKYAYITSRGLMRSSWATDIQAIGLPKTSIPNLMNILQFNPQLAKYNYNRIYEVINNDIVQVIIQNNNTQISMGFVGKGVTKANIEADKYMRREINKLFEKDINV